MADKKKQKVPLEWVNVIYFIFLIVLVVIVFLLNGKMHSVLFLLMIWITMAIIAIILKAIVLSGDREINNKDVGDIFLSSFLSTLLIIGSAMLTVNQVPIVGRSFENTVGYWRINNDDLTKEMNNVFINNSGQSINLIATQLFTNDDADAKQNFHVLIEEVEKNFSNVIEIDKATDPENLRQIILAKKNISESTFISLATIAAFYTSYMPIIQPWIIGS